MIGGVAWLRRWGLNWSGKMGLERWADGGSQVDKGDEGSMSMM